MDYAQLLTTINAAIPGALAIIHIFTDSDTGATTVTILERAKTKAQSTQAVIEAWNKLHPATPPA